MEFTSSMIKLQSRTGRHCSRMNNDPGGTSMTKSKTHGHVLFVKIVRLLYYLRTYIIKIARAHFCNYYDCHKLNIACLKEVTFVGSNLENMSSFPDINFG